MWVPRGVDFYYKELKHDCMVRRTKFVRNRQPVRTVTTLPLLAVPFKNKIRTKITQHIEKALE